MKVGDMIGGLYKKTLPDGSQRWELVETKVTKIVSNSRGTKCYSKRFYPLDVEDVETTTQQMEHAEGYVLTREPMLLTDTVRKKCERWVEWANTNPNKAVSVLCDITE